MTCGIYKIENTINGRCYVGSAMCVEKRWSDHASMLNSGCHHSRKLQRAWNKRGGEAFQFTVIEHVSEPVLLVSREQHWIGALRAYGVGYNMAPMAGSSLGIKRSDETRAKIAAVQRGTKRGSLSDVTRAKISASHMGKRREPHTLEQRAARSEWQTGKRHTPESIERMRAAQKGRVISVAAREKLSIAHRGKKLSQEHRAKVSAALIGRAVSDATRAKLSAALTGKKRKPCTDERRSEIADFMRGRKWSPEQIAKRVATMARNKALRAAPGRAYQA